MPNHNVTTSPRKIRIYITTWAEGLAGLLVPAQNYPFNRQRWCKNLQALQRPGLLALMWDLLHRAGRRLLQGTTTATHPAAGQAAQREQVVELFPETMDAGSYWARRNESTRRRFEVRFPASQGGYGNATYCDACFHPIAEAGA